MLQYTCIPVFWQLNHDFQACVCAIAAASYIGAPILHCLLLRAELITTSFACVHAKRNPFITECIALNALNQSPCHVGIVVAVYLQMITEEILASLSEWPLWLLTAPLVVSMKDRRARICSTSEF